ncbi:MULTISPECIES: TIGR02646 family protein [Pseudomonas]|uniref:TIGR02646 family protein n=1 Tax=Pseudomonas aphyarum TaxID=2942629 RepID=A0ABT5PK35_9PSED|nr:TIGR02646 family protein [Pseudomonas aphyarum]MDD0970452.1 TIGR02646 family protein [Pseudomonas aphyarum]MDD1124255.1 TIGR02646 family protein [Pseudomonas aphyarum]
MRKIIKGNEPEQLTKWMRANNKLRYGSLPPEERQSVRAACIKEQFGLCAYCCQSISPKAAHNEHVESQDRAPARTLDFTNIVASCESRTNCGHRRKTKRLDLTPFMDECETELKFYLNGLVEGTTARAKASIEALNLGHSEESNRGLIGRRRAMVEILIYDARLKPDELMQIEDKELLEMLAEELESPVAGNLQAFSPVLVNVIRQLLP